jgi:GR25 family glycosyltransferase involved in LPS biosynthesis
MIINHQPKTFIIAIKNHKISESQLNDCIESAKKFFWNVDVFWGVDGRTITNDAWINEGIFPRLDKDTMFKPGVQGCFLSHWNLWKKCVELDQPIIILEHDAIIQNIWLPIELTHPLIKLHKHYKKKETRIDPDSGIYTVSTHAYLITPDAANTLIKFVKMHGAFESDRLVGDKIVSYKHLEGESLIERQNTHSTTKHI